MTLAKSLEKGTRSEIGEGFNHGLAEIDQRIVIGNGMAIYEQRSGGARGYVAVGWTINR
jgi:hypothetical protein